MLEKNNKNSIYFQLLLLLIISAVIAGATFFIFERIGERVVEYYYINSDYEKKKDQIYVQKLQSYITQHELSSDDRTQLTDWVEEQQILQVSIFKDGKLIFDTDYPDEMFESGQIDISQYIWENYYTITFEDGDAEVTLWGIYMYQAYTYANIVEMILTFLVFLTLVLLGIRSKMQYIRKLSEEIGILEGGGLDYNITVKGNDELTTLAVGLDQMRISLHDLMEQESQIVRENKKIVTEMSHDIRTPITSILLYTEILKKNKYKDEAQLKNYIEIIDQKAVRLKQLTDHLFAYVLIAGEQVVTLEEPESYELIFYDLISETVGYLNQNGFQVDAKLDALGEKIRVNTNYITRIMENIASNIIKYADSNDAIEICAVKENDFVGLSCQNRIIRGREQIESTRVGVESVRTMMKRMDGKCIINEKDEVYCITILFPIQ